MVDLPLRFIRTRTVSPQSARSEQLLRATSSSCLLRHGRPLPAEHPTSTCTMAALRRALPSSPSILSSLSPSARCYASSSRPRAIPATAAAGAGSSTARPLAVQKRPISLGKLPKLLLLFFNQRLTISLALNSRCCIWRCRCVLAGLRARRSLPARPRAPGLSSVSPRAALIRQQGG